MFKWLKDARKLPQVERERDDAIHRAKNADRSAEMANEHLAAVTKQLAEAQKKIRQQNEADLLLVSMQLVNRLTAGEKKDSPAVQSLLQQQAALAQNIYPQGAYNTGVLGGLGNIFGPYPNWPFQ